jgi:hypothetical protein
MTDVHGEGGDLPALAFGVEGKSHGGARGKPRRQEVVRAGSAVEPTEGYGLIGEEPMPPDVHDLLKTTLARRADPYALIARSFRPMGKRWEITAAPGADDLGDKDGVLPAGEEMVGTVERHEAFRMPRGLEDPLGVLDSNNIIGRSMEDEKRPAEVPDLRLKVLDAQIFEKLLANGEPSSGEFMSLMLGVRRAGVSVTANVLKQAGLIHYTNGHMTILDRPGLEDAACECYGTVQRQFEQLLG